MGTRSHGDRRPADVAANAVRVMRIATGGIEETSISGKTRGRHVGADSRVTATTARRGQP